MTHPFVYRLTILLVIQGAHQPTSQMEWSQISHDTCAGWWTGSLGQLQYDSRMHLAAREGWPSERVEVINPCQMECTAVRSPRKDNRAAAGLQMTFCFFPGLKTVWCVSQEYIAAGANLEAQDFDLNRPIHVAVLANNVDLLKVGCFWVMQDTLSSFILYDWGAKTQDGLTLLVLCSSLWKQVWDLITKMLMGKLLSTWQLLKDTLRPSKYESYHSNMDFGFSNWVVLWRFSLPISRYCWLMGQHQTLETTRDKLHWCLPQRMVAFLLWRWLTYHSAIAALKFKWAYTWILVIDTAERRCRP